MTETIVSDDLSETIVKSEKRLGNFTVEQLLGNWIINTANGEIIHPYNYYIFHDKNYLENGVYKQEFTVVSEDENGSAIVVTTTSSWEMLRGKYIRYTYPKYSTTSTYEIQQLFENRYVSKKVDLASNSYTTEQSGLLYSATRVTEEIESQKVIGVWRGKIFIEGADDLEIKLTISQQSDGSYNFSWEDKYGTEPGKLHLWGNKVSIMEFASSFKDTQGFYMTISDDGKIMNWNHHKFFFFSDPVKMYGATAKLTKVEL